VPTDSSGGDPERERDAALDERRRLYHQMLELVTRLAEDQQSLKEMQRHVRV
jgi:hypothetical protein